MKKILILALAAIFLLPVLPISAQVRGEIVFEDTLLVNIASPVEVTLKTTESFEKVVFYLDGDVVSEFEDDGNRERALELDLSGAPYLGEAEISAVVYYEVPETLTKTVYLTKLENEINENFSADFEDATQDIPNPVFNYNTNIEANESKISLVHYVYDGNKALEAKMSGSITSKEPFMLKDGLAVADGANIEVSFDVYFALTNRAYLKLETRDLSSSKQPTNDGAGMPVIPLFKGITTIDGGTYNADTWYNCKILMNTISKGLKIYLKTATDTEYTLRHELPKYNSVGLNQIRFCVGSLSGDGGSVILDNIKVSSQKEESLWYAKPVFKNTDDTTASKDNFAVKDGKIEIAFSKAVENFENNIKMYNSVGDVIEHEGEYNKDTFIYTAVPKKALKYNSEYTLEISDGVTSVDESPRLSYDNFKFKTERYPVYVSGCENTSEGVKITFGGYENITDEVAAVYTMSDERMHSVNMIKLSADSGEVNISLTKPEGDYKVYILILNSKDRLTVNEVYIND